MVSTSYRYFWYKKSMKKKLQITLTISVGYDRTLSIRIQLSPFDLCANILVKRINISTPYVLEKNHC